MEMKWPKIFGGPTMAALAAGTTAPDFSLPTMDGKEFPLQEALRRGPVVAAFFKVSCPVCQYAFPFLERLHRAHGMKNIAFIGISQNEKKDTAAFIKEYGVTFPVLLDVPDTFPASNAYGLTNVPTVFYISQGGEIEVSSVGWSRQDIEEINAKAARATGEGPRLIFQADEQVVDFRAG
jgi:peroxiredoxin